MKTKQLRKQVPVEFISSTRATINNLLASNLPQSAKKNLCVIVEQLLMNTKNYNGFQYNYWSRYGCAEWQDAKTKAVFKDHIPHQYILGPDYVYEDSFTSDIQGEYSRYYK